MCELRVTVWDMRCFAAQSCKHVPQAAETLVDAARLLGSLSFSLASCQALTAVQYLISISKPFCWPKSTRQYHKSCECLQTVCCLHTDIEEGQCCLAYVTVYVPASQVHQIQAALKKGSICFISASYVQHENRMASRGNCIHCC